MNYAGDNMNLELGINLGFAINKYIEPEEWARFFVLF